MIFIIDLKAESPKLNVCNFGLSAFGFRAILLFSNPNRAAVCRQINVCVAVAD